MSELEQETIKNRCKNTLLSLAGLWYEDTAKPLPNGRLRIESAQGVKNMYEVLAILLPESAPKYTALGAIWNRRAEEAYATHYHMEDSDDIQGS